MAGRYRKVSFEPLIEMVEVIRKQRGRNPGSEEFKNLFGITSRTYFRMMRLPEGERRINLHTAERIADALGDHPSVIFPDYEEEVTLGYHSQRKGQS